MGFMVLDTASTSWKWCVNPWYYEVITCDGLSLWEGSSHLIQFPKRVSHRAAGNSSSSLRYCCPQVWNH